MPGEVATRYVGRLFAQLGADVIAVGRRDDQRLGYGGARGVAYGRWLDAGKVMLDQAPTDQDVDLVICGQDGEALASALEAAPPGVPRLELTWFAPEGPYADWRGADEIILALTGLAYGFGEPAGPPMLAQGHGPQLAAGLTAFNAALAALLWPKRHRPRRIAVNIFEAAMCFTETGALTTRVDGSTSSRLGVNRFVPTYPCSSYRTSDGWVGVTALTPAQWRALAQLVGRPDLADDPRFATAYERLMLGDEVDSILQPVFRQRTTAEWVALGDAHRIPTAPMHRPGELPTVEHWVDRASFGEFEGSGLSGPTLPFRMSFDGARAAFQPSAGEGPLSGLKVVDFSMGWAGPLCTRTLGDLGAEVVKVESISHPDWWRGWEIVADADPPPIEIRHNFFAVNRNKRDVVIEMTASDGLAQARALVSAADVVVENFAAGVLAKLGLGPAVQRALRPGLISISMPAFGNGGPLSGLRAYGSTVEQASGLPFMNGEAHWPPCLQHVAYGDPLAGLYAAAAVVAALHGRDRLGGCDIDLAQVACLFQFGADAIIAEQVEGSAVPRTGLTRARTRLTAVLPAQGADRWLAVSAGDDAAWRAICDVVGMAEHAPGDEVETALAAWVHGRDAHAAAAQLQSAGVAAAPVQPTHDLTSDPQLAASAFWTFMERRYVGRHMVSEAPFTYDGRRPSLRLPAPTLGEHNDEVFAELAATVAA